MFLILLFLFPNSLPAQETGPPKVPPATSAPAVGGDPAAAEIFKTFDAIPFDNLRVRGEPLQQLHANVDKLLIDCEHYLKEHPASASRPRVTYIFAKVRSLNMQRFLLQKNREYQQKFGKNPPAEYLNNQRREYFQLVLDYIDQALSLGTAKSPPVRSTVVEEGISPDLRRDLLKVRGYCLHLDGRWPQAAEQYDAIMKDYPQDQEGDKSLCGLIQARIRAGSQDSKENGLAEYREAVVACERFYASYPKSDLFPHVINFHGKALKEMGDAKGGVEHWKKYRPMIEAGALNPSLSSKMRKDYNQVLDQVDFNLGFLSYAMGDAKGALKYFEDAINFLTEREKSGKLSQVGQVYKSRTERVANTLRTIQGQSTPPLDIEYSWVDGDSFEVKQEQGNVVALFFSSYGTRRSIPFAQFVDRFNREHWHEGFRAAMVAYLKGNRDPEGQILAAGQWRRSLDLAYPVGLDDTQGKQVYKRYNAMVGSGTIVVIDRQGNLAWYKIDPTERDVNLAREVFLRLLAQ